MKKVTLTLFCLVIVAVSWAVNVNVESPDEIAYVDIGVEETAQLLIRSQDVTILDVRTRVEYESGHIAGATSIPLSELEGRIDELHRDRAIIVNCKSGVRSRNASNILVNHGFENVYNLLGGINAWIDTGFPVISSSTTSQEEQDCPCETNPSGTHDECETAPENCTCSFTTCLASCLVIDPITVVACAVACGSCFAAPNIGTCIVCAVCLGVGVQALVYCVVACHEYPCMYGYVCPPCQPQSPSNRRCYDSDTYEIEVCRCDGQGWNNWKRKDCPEGKKCCDPGGLCRECCTDADCDDGDCCTDDKCEEGVCKHIDITPDVCAGVTCPEGEHCVCQCGSPVCVPDLSEPSLSVLFTSLAVMLVYIALRRRKKQPP